MSADAAVIVGIVTVCAVLIVGFLGAIATSIKNIADHLEQITHNTRKEYKDR